MRNLVMFVLFALPANAAFAGNWTKPIPITMNSFYFDHEMPSISHDGTKLFFSSDSDGIANGPADIYYSLKSDSEWGLPIFLGNIVNDTIQGRQELSPCIGYDDTTLYFARSYVNDSIWVTYYTNGDWLPPQPLDSAINKLPAGGPAISRDGQKLYFHSSRPGGYGGCDIWMSQKTGGAWQEPVNMGPEINTSFNEKEPSIAANDSDFVFWRSGNDSDTCNIWHYKIGSGKAAECILYSHYEGIYAYYFYWGPCITADGQHIYLTYVAYMEPLSNIRISNKVSGVAGKPENNSYKATLSLSPNSPNPFSRYTSIRYQLPISGHVDLTIYNIAGQLVRTLVNEEKGAGNHNAIWDGYDKNNRKAAQGTYFCKLESSCDQLIQKIVLIK